MDAEVVERDLFLVIRLRGRMDVEAAERFRGVCRRVLVGRRILLNFSGLSFVGSNGIIAVLDMLNQLTEGGHDNYVHFCGVSGEFRKLFLATPLSRLSFHEDEEAAFQSMNLGIIPAPLKDPFLEGRPVRMISLKRDPIENEDEAANISGASDESLSPREGEAH